MGQKVNPNIFRLGVNKTWKTKFFEKKSQELPLYIFKDLEIKNYIERFLEKHDLILHDYKQHYSNSTLNLYVSYFITSDFNLKRDNAQELTVINESGGKRRGKSNTRTTSSTSNAEGKLQNEAIDSRDFYKVRKYLTINQHRDLRKLVQAEPLLIPNDQFVRVRNRIKIKSVFDQFFKVLNLFTKNKLNIVVNFCCISS